MLAREAGVSPATMYTYFSGRDAIVLTATSGELCAWLADLSTRVDRASSSIPEIVDHVVDSLDQHHTARRLLPALPALLERVGGEEADDAKAALADHVRLLEAAIRTGVPQLDGERAVRALRALVVGLWSFATGHPGDPTETELAWFRQELRITLTATLRGLIDDREG